MEKETTPCPASPVQTPLPADAAWLDGFLLALPGVRRDYKAEWGWDRYLLGDKQFAALCCPGAEHAAVYAGHPLLSVKAEPAAAEFWRAQYPDILPGFYCDKRCWLSVRLDGDVPAAVLRELTQTSHRLVWAKLTKKVQRALAAGQETAP